MYIFNEKDKFVLFYKYVKSAGAFMRIAGPFFLTMQEWNAYGCGYRITHKLVCFFNKDEISTGTFVRSVAGKYRIMGGNIESPINYVYP
jgi:hypothetical protein